MKSANPINSYQLDGSISRAYRWDTSDRVRQWTQTVWRRWALRQPECVMTIPFEIGPAVRIRPIVGRKVIADSYGESRRERIHRVLNHYEIHINEVLADMRENPDQHIYEVELYPGIWCMLHSPWQWKMLSTSDTFEWWVADGREQLRMLYDWMREFPNELPKDMSRLSVEEAQRKCRVWHDEMARVESDALADVGERLEIMPGVYQLLDEQALWREGNYMHHCADQYWSDVRQGHSLIFHVDDPRATVELRHGRVFQAAGPCNAPVELPPDVLAAILKHVTVDLNRPIAAGPKVNEPYEP